MPSRSGPDRGPSWVEVATGQAGQRVDNFLMARLKGVPKGRIYRMLRTGEVRINGGRCRAGRRLEAGDSVRIPPVQTQPNDRGAVPTAARDAVGSAFLFEDAEVAILAKPAGMAVHSGSGLAYGVIEALQAARPEAEWGLAHRLDRGTSGCLVVGKSAGATRRLQQAFRDGEVTKAYLALVVGDWPQGPEWVEAALRRQKTKGGRRSIPDPEGQEAQTRFVPLRRLAGFTLVRAELVTGRTHQIRAHARWADHPLAGDTEYGDPDVNARLKPQGLERPFLHSAEVRLPHPTTGEELAVEAPLPDELSRLLESLAHGNGRG